MVLSELRLNPDSSWLKSLVNRFWRISNSVWIGLDEVLDLEDGFDDLDWWVGFDFDLDGILLGCDKGKYNM